MADKMNGVLVVRTGILEGQISLTLFRSMKVDTTKIKK